MMRLRFEERQTFDHVERRVRRRANPSVSSIVGFRFDNLVKNLLPCALNHFRICRGKIRPGKLEIEHRLFVRGVLCVQKPLSNDPHRCLKTSALSRLIVVEVKHAASPLKNAESLLHRHSLGQRISRLRPATLLSSERLCAANKRQVPAS